MTVDKMPQLPGLWTPPRSRPSSPDDYELISPTDMADLALDDSSSTPDSSGYSPYCVLDKDSSSPHANTLASPTEPADSKPQSSENRLEATAPSPQPSAPVPAKRPRGRPRKHPINKSKPEAKEGRANNGRSKTGCMTCRRRKKKCDEAKPFCRNCEKNNLKCEGYPQTTQWQAGRQKSEPKGSSLPPLLPDLSDELDTFLFNHFQKILGSMQDVGSDANLQSILEIVMPLTPNDTGLMSTVLAMSGFKLVRDQSTPLPAAFTIQTVEDRAIQHHSKAASCLRGNFDTISPPNDAMVASSIMLCLISAENDMKPRRYSTHLAGIHAILSTSGLSDDVHKFARQFLKSHYTCYSITCAPEQRRQLFPQGFRLPEIFVTAEAGQYFGVVDELFLFLHEVRELRDAVRTRRERGEPLCDNVLLERAIVLDRGLRGWRCQQAHGGAFEAASELWRACIWIYLKRSINTLPQLGEIQGAVDDALASLVRLRAQPAVQATLVMPLFVLGCSALGPAQRRDVDASFDILLAHRHADNLKAAQGVVHNIWRLLDCRVDDAWDWERVIERLGIEVPLA